MERDKLKNIYLDHQATTKVDPRVWKKMKFHYARLDASVLEVMKSYFNKFSNPHSRSHAFGWSAEAAVNLAREQIASLIGAEDKDIIFTSGATESNNLAIQGVARFYENKGNHIITACTEHKCVLDSCRHLEDEGFTVTYLPVQTNGIIDLSVLENAITNKTILVSVMMVNNEMGVIQPIKEIGEICRKHDVFFHTDAAQAFGKVPIDVNNININLMSISSHEIYGPMGIGALYVRRKNPRVRLAPLISGGGQERGMRSGTVPTPLAAGFGEAARIVKERMVKTDNHSSAQNIENINKDAVNLAREQIASLIGAEDKEIIFTSGATESNNMAIKGVARFYKNKGNHIITVCTEHKCVLDSCRHLEDEGFTVTYLPVQTNGIIDLSKLEEAITDKTILVSVMMANNEIGVIQPIKEVGKICRKHGAFFHTDAAQAFGKVPIDVNDMNIDLMSISSHKIYGPMGIGALYVRRKNPCVRLTPLFSGDGQERGMRSGTVPTPLAAGFGEAARIAQEEMKEESLRIKNLRDILYNKIKEKLPYVVLNGDYEQRIPGNLNVSFPYVEGESLIMAIKELAVSSGSACTSASLEPSYVVRALNNGHDLEHSSIRFGIGRFTTKEEIIYAADLVTQKVGKLRDMSPLWEMVQEGIDLESVQWDAH